MTIFNEVHQQSPSRLSVYNNKLSRRNYRAARFGQFDGTRPRRLLGLAHFWSRDRESVANSDSLERQALSRLMRKMDAENAPIKFYWSSETHGLLYVQRGGGDTDGPARRYYQVARRGIAAESDTTAAAMIRARLVLAPDARLVRR